MATPYVSREDALALVVEQRSTEILQMATEQSVAMQTFNKQPVSSSQWKLSQVDSFPSAKWLVATPPADVDVAPKPTTSMSWSTVDGYVEEAATIAIFPENVLADSERNILAEVKARCSEAIAILIDKTCFFGQSPDGSPVPASFPVGGIAGQAAGHDHAYVWGTVDPAEDLAAAWSETMALVEADGYDVGQAYSDRGIRPYFRNLRDKNGTLMYGTSLQNNVAVDAVYGVPVNYVTSGIWDRNEAVAIMGDPEYAILGIRSQLEAKMLSEATVGDVNLAEQDAIALRMKIRLGFLVLAPKGLGQTANPYPFAVLSPKGTVVATGATEGKPGTWAPAGSIAPANLAGTTGVLASPATAWATSSYVVLNDGSRAAWNGTAWVAK